MSSAKDTVLIFDYDGTLHRCERIYAPVFRSVFAEMVAEGILPDRAWTLPEITKYLGCSAVEMWADFLPNGDPAIVQKYSSKIGAGMLEQIAQGNARWYDGAEDTLQTLHDRGYEMVVLSNCRVKYLQAHRQLFAMDRFFSGYYACEAYDFAPKTEIFPQIRAEHPAKSYVVIGDRRHDMELAKVHQLSAIGCSYGYGTAEEMAAAEHRIAEISELLALLP